LTLLIEGFTESGDLVLDPFCGSGSTPVAQASFVLSCSLGWRSAGRRHRAALTMPDLLTKEQTLVPDMARNFSRYRLAPGAANREKAGEIELEVIAKMAELGFLGMTVPAEMGGAGAD
jgi:alkylation response protein AidB-like acyl-CoA dehydrogenase